MLSYWEKESFTHFDHAIIGGGIVGLSAALSLKTANPEKSVVLLEKGLRPTGASTKNAGFACFGSPSELLEDLENIGEDGMLKLVEQRWTGLQRLRSRIGDENMGFENFGGYEVLEKKDLWYMDKLEMLNRLLQPVFSKKVFHPANERIKDFGFNKDLAAGMVFNPFESQINTGKTMRSLWDMALSAGIHILTGAEVTSCEDDGEGIRITVRGSSLNDEMHLKVRNTGICTNAFTRQLFPEIPLSPGRGQVLVTSPVPDLKFRGTFHMERGFYYFRNLGDRLLFGGGRHLQMQEETTTDFGENPVIREKLEEYLRELILPGISWSIDHSWSGIMAFGENKKPYIKEHKPNIYTGLRLGGMGVAIGTHIGEKLADMMSGE